MRYVFKKIFIITVFVAFLPATALAAQVNLQLLINPAAPNSTAGSGASGTGSGGGNNTWTRGKRNSVSGWTSPNAYVEAIIGNSVVGTGIAGVDGAFTFNASVDGLRTMTYIPPRLWRAGDPERSDRPWFGNRHDLRRALAAVALHA